jgi:serine/threonine-protein kinase
MAYSQNATAPVKEGDVLAAKYRIEKVIGVGGMGIVVSAMHLELDQRVALKFLLPQAALNEELVGRFVREAKSSVKLKGTHVAKVLDVGRMDDGRAYIVMEYLEGRDLGAELKASQEQLAIEDAVSWMLQACEGLAEAHALGIVHRDLKPGNLFLTRGLDDRPLVKLLDFGISKSINPNASDMLSLTKTEMLLGSPLYMAPEQMRSSKYVDERSDIWGLGAIAYELLTRRVPFEADTLLDLCFKVAQEGCVAVHEVRSDVPVALSDVVMRCLEKDPQSRYTDIGELAVALEPFASEADRGSAARTIAVLASGIQRARAPAPSDPEAGKSNPAAARVGDSSDSKRTSDAKRVSDAKRNSAAKPKHISEEHLVTGTATTERAVSDVSEATDGADAVDAAASDASAPDAVPASSAWGTTNAAEVERKKSRRGLVAIVGLAVVVAGVAAAISRNSAATATVPTATTGAISAWETPSSSPSAVASASASAAPALASSASAIASTEPTAVATVATSAAAVRMGAPPARPRPSSSASAAAAPTTTAPPSARTPAEASSGGFIRVRE